jgi:sterol desaturase/sphingolipid hydroxylase (fatty acid hydroxylase superfamily)
LIHKRHHEHNEPQVWTNQHFSIPDLFIEAIFPMIAAFGTLIAAGIKISPLEQKLLGNYVIWLEALSHSGKPMPCTSLLAPLAPLYNYFFQWDRRNVEFHHSHHQLLRCNYSITPWADHLFGTTKW